MNVMKRIMLFACSKSLCLFAGMAVMAQDQKFATVKNFLPPSPDVAAFAKYGDIPVSIPTGVPDISIPVYEIKSRKLTLPLSLSYHASGIRVDEIASVAGLGWVFNAGGMISRTVVGLPDDKSGGFPDTSPGAYKSRTDFSNTTYNPDDYYYLNRMAANTGDSQSDLYNFNLPTVAGRFMFDTKGKLHYTPTDRQIKFTRNNENSYSVVDDGGNIYEFNSTETTATMTGTASSAVTCWYMTRMISADRGDTISFTYKDATPLVDFFDSYTFTLSFMPSVNGSNLGSMTPSVSAPAPTQMNYSRKLLDRIDYAGGYVQMEYANDRQDPGNERLTKVKIFNNAGMIREVALNHSYYGADGITKYQKRLKLDGVSFKDANEATVNNYQLVYNATAFPPYYLEGGIYKGKKSTAVDHWGYYNGGSGQTLIPDGYANELKLYMTSRLGLVDDYVMNIYNQNAGSREVNPSFSQAGMLKKIIYPTGGFTEFYFDNNCVKYPEKNTDLLGGHRVYAILNVDPVAGKSKLKTYTYNEAYPLGKIVPDDFYYYEKVITDVTSGIGGQKWLFTEDLHILCNQISSLSYYNGSPVFYNKVTEYEGFPGKNTGKTEYTYYCEGDTTYGNDVVKNWNLSTDRSWARGQLLNRKVYKNENNAYTLLQETKNEYTDLGVQSFCTGIVCDLTARVVGNSLENFFIVSKGAGSPRILLDYFDYQDIGMTIGTKALKSVETIDYANGQLSRKVTYGYDGKNHLYPTTESTTGSKPGETTTVFKRYPQDKAQITGLNTTASAAVDAMISANMLTEPLESEYRKNVQGLDIPVQKNRTDYKVFGTNGKIYPSQLYQQNGNGPLEPRVEYTSYDNTGNAQTLNYTNGAPVTYIWDYNKTLVAANVKNASINEVAYTSFENSEGGNWEIKGTAVKSGYTGQYAYPLSTGNVEKHGLNSTRKYVVSYWSKTGSANVNGISGTTKSTSLGWTRYEHIITNPTDIIVSGSATIDELKLYPTDAQMTTYTHIPQVGVVATGTFNDCYTFFDYDTYGRLFTARDQDNNILKQYDYAFQDPAAIATKGNWQLSQSMEQSGLVGGEYIDLEPTSPTYNTKAWVVTGLSNYYGWGPSGTNYTGNTRCQQWYRKNKYVNNGYVEKEVVIDAPFSSYYGSTGWVKAEYNELKCPVPCDEIWEKKINGICETGTQVYTNRYPENIGGQKVCIAIWHYVFSDGSVSNNFQEMYYGECPEDQ